MFCRDCYGKGYSRFRVQGLGYSGFRDVMAKGVLFFLFAGPLTPC